MKNKSKIPHIISIIITAIALVGFVYSTALFAGVLQSRFTVDPSTGEAIGGAISAVLLVIFGIGTAIVAAIAFILNMIALAMKPQGKLKVSVITFTATDAIIAVADVLYIIIAVALANSAS